MIRLRRYVSLVPTTKKKSRVVSFSKLSVKTFLIVSLLLVSFDQLTKIQLENSFPLQLVRNDKGAFGILPWWLAWLGLLGLSTWVIFYKRFGIGESLVLAGGVSNLLDRVLRKSVVDFIQVSFLPIFNLADIFLTIGVVIVIITHLGLEKRK